LFSGRTADQLGMIRFLALAGILTVVAAAA
jgi:hypothetical protein